jgi:hypothetical protein
MNLKDWNKIGVEYSAVHEARRTTVFSTLLARLNTSRPETLLDYGGGDGLFAVDCASLPIKQITVYDPAPNMVSLARKNCASISRIRVVESSSELQAGTFNVVTQTAVWMCLPTEEECLNVLRDVHRLLTSDGEMIAAVTHPCFRDRRFSTYRTDFSLKNYLNDGIEFGVTISDGSKEIHVSDTHWSLGAMSRQLKRAGFVMTELLELPDQMTNQDLKSASPWLIVFARKVS